MSKPVQNKSKPIQRPAVVFNPDLLAGIDTIANMVKPTLGPLPRFVAMERMSKDKAPELLDDAATLARRVVQLPHPTVDVGAMLLRHTLWRMHEMVGDGTATTAVLAQALMSQANKAVAAGANPMMLKRGIEAAIEAACSAIKKQSQPVGGSQRGRAAMKALVRSICSDEELAERLSEAVSFGGPDAYIEVLSHEPRRIDRDYVEGSLWEAVWHNANFATDKARTITRINDVAFVIVEQKIESAVHAIEGLKRIHQAGYQRAAIMVGEVAEDAMNFFNTAHHRGLMQLALVKSPGFDANRAINLGDISALTGARIVMGDGAGFASITPADIGYVRRLWVNDKKLGLIGGHRNSLFLRHHIKTVRADIENLNDLDRLSDLRKRLGRLTGAWILLRVGGSTSGHAEARQDEARRLVRAMQTAVRGGVVAGGGAALVAAAQALVRDKGLTRFGDAVKHTSLTPSALHLHPFTATSSSSSSTDLDYKMGQRCVAHALEAPLRELLANAGIEASPIVARVREAGAPCGFDLRSKQITNLLDAGVVDSAEVVQRALRNAGSLATMAITTAVVVHHRKPNLQVKT